ncbi:MAG TPA: extracellular solute-binding protein [Microbacteriaceae bacterium]
MMAKKSVVKVGAGVVAALLLLSGCSAQTSGTAKVDLNKVDYSGTITMVNKFADPTTSAFFPAMAKAYEKLHPNVKVTIQQESDQGYKDKIKVLTTTHNLPDIYFSWAGDYAKQFVNAGFALDLSSQIGADTTWGKTLAPSAVAAFEYSGKNYGVPLDLDAKFMLYNKKIFSSAGLAAPKTLDDLLNSCKTLKASGIDPIAFGNKNGWPAIHYITQLNAYNVPAATLAADYNPKVGKFTDAGYVKALTQFKQLLDDCTSSGAKSIGIDHNDAAVSFYAGKQAMMYQEWVEFGAVDGTQLAKDDWSFFQLPAPAGAAGATDVITGAPDGFLINPKAKNAALAVDFMKFVVSKDNAKIMQKLMIGYPSPVLGSLTPDNASPQSVDALDVVNKASGFAIWLDTVTAPPVAQAYLADVEGLISGSVTPEDVMKSVQTAAAGVR